MANIRDDERYLLAISRPSGCLVACPAISSSRMTGIRRKWTLMGWLKPGSDELTRKAMACKVVLPDLSPVAVAEPVAPPIEFTPAAETVVEVETEEEAAARRYSQGTYIGSPLMDDNELELPEESSVECESIDCDADE